MKKPELVFVPIPGAGHLTSAVEAAKLLLDRDARLSISILILRRSSDSKVVSDLIDSLTATITSHRIQFINLPNEESESMGLDFIEKYKPHIREAVSKLATRSDFTLAGFVLDMFCMPVIDVANEFGVPSYVFFTSGAAFFGFMLHLRALHDEQEVDPTQFKNSDDELALPCFVNPLPARVLPSVLLEKESMPAFLEMSRRFREAKGIIVNTFMELESSAINSLSDGTIESPPVYPVGPILNLKGGDSVGSAESKEIMEWLDDQPPSSVVFLCFGSMGGFREDQAKEIAFALERCGQRFLWSLCQPLPMGKMTGYTDCQNLEGFLPEEFLDRTAGIGKVIGWAPQVAVLAQPAIGGFVSHCGWNSTLESIWYGVPIATWPMYAEQQFNAFQLVTELGLAVEITVDYRKDSDVIVKAADIERGVRCVMEQDSEIRMKVKEMSEKSRKVLMDGGSAFSSLNRLIEDAIDNMP
ncbi:anthocyanidin 3-O-glucosyltransferase 6 [Ricinus communis]|uniref:anthocyanidin 3-O-glucosyltransferase 6 n=1 Tax=Ricinus communis TaxID=3988 RepID=UPI00201A2436|nr:anthocyanidin 3-O-glucosyltransferase 6 [Ricinus communis]